MKFDVGEFREEIAECLRVAGNKVAGLSSGPCVASHGVVSLNDARSWFTSYEAAEGKRDRLQKLLDAIDAYLQDEPSNGGGTKV